EIAKQYQVSVGERVDRSRLEAADEALQAQLRKAGYFHATVQHHQKASAEQQIRLRVEPGPKIQIRFEGLRAMDAAALRSALELDLGAVATAELQSQILDTCERHGYCDAGVALKRVSSADGAREDWIFRVHEGRRLRVTSRFYPCLAGP